MRAAAAAALIGLGLLAPGLARADVWGPRVIAHCYALDGRDGAFAAHLSVRVVWTEVGRGELVDADARGEGVMSVEQLAATPVSCRIAGREVRFEALGYAPPLGRGPCGLCVRTGFRLTSDGATVWERPWDEATRTLFLGTVDVDEAMARVCTEHPPDAMGVELPYRPDFFASRTSVLVCVTYPA